MAVFSVDSDNLAATTQSVQHTAIRIQGDTAGMVAQLNHLQTTWTGGASVAFQQVVENWRGIQRTVDEQFAALALALGSAGRQYAETEQATTGMFRM